MIGVSLEKLVKHFEVVQFDSQIQEEPKEVKAALTDLVADITEDLPPKAHTESYIMSATSSSSDNYDVKIYSDADRDDYYKLSSENSVTGTSSTVEAYEGWVLENAQELASQLKEASETNKPMVEVQFDEKLKAVRDDVKMTSTVLWYLMWDGKVKFY